MTTGSPTANRPESTPQSTPPRPGRLATVKDGAKRFAHAGLEPLVRLFVAAGVGPDSLTALGCIFSVFSGIAFFEGGFRLGSLLMLLSGLCDILDGQVARTRQSVSRFGAFLDSTLDRAEEGIVLAAVAAYFAAVKHDDLAVAAVVIAVLGSLLVSYTRARAEALGVECKVGIATRAVRVVILSIGLVFARGAGLGDFSLLKPAIYALALLTSFTVFQRVFHVRRELNRTSPA